jgi:antitoxin FitA
MWGACAILVAMGKMVQVRNVPDQLHRELTRRARARGQTLTDYIQEILEREVSRPPAAEVFQRISARPPVKLGRPAAELIHEERTARQAS